MIDLLLEKLRSVLLNLTHADYKIDRIFNEIISFNRIFNLQSISVSGDGNCYFRIISVVLFGSDKHHRLIRYLTVYAFIKNQKYFSSPQMHGSFECMVEKAPYSKVTGCNTTKHSFKSK